jgi:hypothetical protein
MKDMKDFPINLGIVVGSHLNDAMIEISINPERARKRLQFVKALTFFNENLELSVTPRYCDWLWNEIFENGRWGAPYVKDSNYVI